MEKSKFLETPIFKEILKPIIVLLAICIVIPLALSLTNAITKDRIAELDAKTAKETMSALLKADSFEETVYEGETVFIYNKALINGETTGYIFINMSKGYGGDVKVMTAVDTTGKILGVAILDAANETPGLGQNVTKENFYLQFKDKSGEIFVKKNGADSSKMEIDAVTGATISSKAVANAVNEALTNYGLITAPIYDEGTVENSEEF